MKTPATKFIVFSMFLTFLLGTMKGDEVTPNRDQIFVSEMSSQTYAQQVDLVEELVVESDMIKKEDDSESSKSLFKFPNVFDVFRFIF